MRISKMFLSSILFFSSVYAYSLELKKEDIDPILKFYELEGMNTKFSFQKISKESSQFQNKISFVEALNLALHSIIHDGQDIESPYALFLEDAFSNTQTKWKKPIPDVVHKETLSLVKRQLLDKETTLYFTEDMLRPEGGENKEDYWIFHLKMNYGDYLHWVMVSRDGKEVYNYGFN